MFDFGGIFLRTVNSNNMVFRNDTHWIGKRIHVKGIDKMKDVEKIKEIEEMYENLKPRPILVVKAYGHTFYAHLEDNPSAREFIERLSREQLEVEMEDCSDVGKVGELPWKLEKSDEEITAKQGDIILYEEDKIAFNSDEKKRSFTRLARLGDTGRDKLLEADGEGTVKVSFSIEWSE